MTTSLTVTAKPEVAAVLVEVTGALAGPLTILRFKGSLQHLLVLSQRVAWPVPRPACPS
jgi:hypothetical protein